MMVAYTLLSDDYQWAAGYDNTAGLTLVSTTIPSTDIAFNTGEIVSGLPNYNPGIAKIRGTGRVGRAGFPSTFWDFGFWTLLQYQYLQTTFCGGAGNYSGLVTIRTRTGLATFSNFNAVINVPTPDQLEWQNPFYIAPRLTFTRLVLIPPEP